MLYIAEDINYLSAESSKELRDKIIEIECKIETLIKKLQSK